MIDSLLYKSWHFSVGLMTFLLVFCTTTDNHAEGLLSVYHQAVASSPVLATSQALLEANRAARPLARAELMPKLDIAAGISRNHTEIVGLGPFESDQSYTGNFYSVSLTQPLFNGPAYIAQDVAEADIRAGQATLQVTEQQLMVLVAEAYFAVIQAQADVNVANNKRSLLLKILDQTETFRKVGTGDIIAVHEARARADASESGLVLAKNSLRLAKQNLQSLTHQPCGQLNDLGFIEAELPKPNHIESWVQAALIHQPRLHRARQELQAAQQQAIIASRTRWPRLDLDVRFSHAKGELLPEMERDEVFAALKMRFPLYQGGEIGAKTWQARSLARASRSSLEDLQDQVRLRTETAFFNLQNSVALLNAASQALTSARTSLDATREGYQVGVRSVIDLLSAVQEFTTVQRNYHVSLYNHVTARIQLKAAAGVLAVEDLEALNALLLPADENPGPS